MFEMLVVIFSGFILWLGTRILDKAGFHKAYVLFLLLPVVNIIMLWYFAFSKWPNSKPDAKNGGVTKNQSIFKKWI